ncbi:MAG: hypothetical protein ACREL7_00735 [Longimicrobiales bacterium]
MNAADPILQLGEDGGFLLFETVGALILSDGILVVENEPPRLRVVDWHGTTIRDAGRAGGGPGEYQTIGSVARLRGDSVFVYDIDAKRVSILDRGLEFARSFALTGDESPMVTRAIPGLGGVVGSTAARIMPGGGPGRYRPETSLVLFDSAGSFRLTLAPMLAREMHVVENGGFIIPLLPRVSIWSATPTNVYLGTGESTLLEAVDPVGVRRPFAEVNADPMVLTEREKRAVVDSLAQRATEARARRVRRTAERVPLPDALPPYDDMLVDDQLHVWVASYGNPLRRSRPWYSYSESGDLLRTVCLPTTLQVTDIRAGVAVGIQLDSVGRERIAAYRLNE